MRALAVAVILVTTVTRSAPAQPAIEDVRLEYRAPKSCPSEAWMVRRIQVRTDRFRRVTDASSARTFSIAIAESPAGYFGTLEITEPDPAARTTSRRIEAPQCIEVADGLALISALTIDPRAASVDAPIEGAAGEQTAEQGPSAATPPETAPVPPATNPVPDRSPELDTPGDDASASAPDSRYVRVGAGFIGVGGVAPRFMVGGQVLAELGVRPGRRWLAWAARLNLRHVRREGLEFPDGSANFQLSTVGVDLCPIRLPVPTLELGPCATGELGLLESEGTDNPDPRQSQRAWAALGALLRAGVNLSRIGIEAHAGAVAPLRRDRFILAQEIGRVEWLVWSAGAFVTGTID